MSRSNNIKHSTQQTRASYNKLSRWYDLLAGSFENKYRMAGLKMLKPEPGETILEIGFGTGHSLSTLVQKAGETGTVFGVELSEGMIHQAKSRLKNQGLYEQVKICQADVMNLPFRKAVFDRIFMSFTIELFEDSDILFVLNECSRCLQENGHICVVSMSKKGGNKLMQKIYMWFHKKMPNLVDCRPIHLKEIIEEAGFLIEETKIISLAGLGCELVLAREPGDFQE